MKIERHINYYLDEIIDKDMLGREKIISGNYVNETAVVVGRVTKSDIEVNKEKCLRDNVPIYRRKGGGGAVVFFKGVAIFSYSLKKGNKAVDLMEFLNLCVERIKEGLERVVDIKFAIKGSGDLCIGDKKILGSSIYSSKEYITYYCTLIVKGDISLISKYLGYPSKEPSYRKGRKHEDFVTSISENTLLSDDDKIFKSVITSLETIGIENIEM